MGTTAGIRTTARVRPPSLPPAGLPPAVPALLAVRAAALAPALPLGAAAAPRRTAALTLAGGGAEGEVRLHAEAPQFALQEVQLQPGLLQVAVRRPEQPPVVLVDLRLPRRLFGGGGEIHQEARQRPQEPAEEPPGRGTPAVEVGVGQPDIPLLRVPRAEPVGEVVADARPGERAQHPLEVPRPELALRQPSFFGPLPDGLPDVGHDGVDIGFGRRFRRGFRRLLGRRLGRGFVRSSRLLPGGRPAPGRPGGAASPTAGALAGLPTDFLVGDGAAGKIFSGGRRRGGGGIRHGTPRCPPRAAGDGWGPGRERCRVTTPKGLPRAPGTPASRRASARPGPPARRSRGRAEGRGPEGTGFPCRSSRIGGPRPGATGLRPAGGRGGTSRRGRAPEGAFRDRAGGAGPANDRPQVRAPGEGGPQKLETASSSDSKVSKTVTNFVICSRSRSRAVRWSILMLPPALTSRVWQRTNSPSPALST